MKLALIALGPLATTSVVRSGTGGRVLRLPLTQRRCDAVSGILPHSTQTSRSELGSAASSHRLSRGC
jgi:hypothetical protein